MTIKIAAMTIKVVAKVAISCRPYTRLQHKELILL